MATRLVRGWTHLERQRGGSIGLRGPGETQLETDRRLLQKRLEQLQKRLDRSEEHTSELQSLMRISYAVFCLKKKKQAIKTKTHKHNTIYNTHAVTSTTV